MVAAIATLTVTGCATGALSDDGIFRGVLIVQARAGEAATVTLDQGDQPCLPLLLASGTTLNAGRLDGRRVVVTGRALPRPPAAPDVMSMEVEGRTFRPFTCAGSNMVLLVDTLAPAG